MSRSENKNSLSKMLVNAVVASSLAIMASCELITFHDPTITMHPHEEGIVLGKDEPIWVDFGQEVDHSSAQRAVTVSDSEGTINVVREWQGHKLLLLPMPEWENGKTLRLSYDGTAYDKHGNQFTESVHRSFIIDPNEAIPELIGSSLSNDMVISPTDFLSLTFSKPIQRELAKRHIAITPAQDIEFTFEMDDTVVIIKPISQWKGLTRFTWRVYRGIKDLSNLGLNEDHMGTFRTMQDTTPISCARFFAFTVNETAVKLPIEALKHGMGVLLEFDEPVNEESLLSSVRFEPYISHTVRLLTESTAIVESVTGRWDDFDKYRLIIKAGLRDISGNSSLNDISFELIPSEPSISVVSVSNDPPGPKERFIPSDSLTTSPQPISVSPTNNAHSFTIEFSAPFSPHEAERLLDAISFRPIFPASLSPPTLNWARPLTENGTSIVLTFIDFDRPRTQLIEERHFYELRIKGGSQGFALDNGTIMKTDFILPVEVIR